MADFIGANNFVPAVVSGVSNGAARLQVADQSLSIPLDGYVPNPGAKVLVSVRPESLRVGAGSSVGENLLRGRVKTYNFLGAVVRYWIDVNGIELIVDDHNPREKGLLDGEVTISLEAAAARLFPDG